ncbi:MAG: oxidoreductase [Nocardioidaceae bacterium]
MPSQTRTAGAPDPLARLAALEGVGSAFAATRDGIDALLRDRGLRRTTPDLTADALLRGAHASAVLEGSESTLEEVRDGVGDEMAQSALRVNAELLSLLPTLAKSPLQALARLHTLAGKGLVADGDLGRPRDPAGATRLRDLAALLTGSTAAPALVVAAVAHAEIASAAPFVSHNGLVARAAERLLLVGRGVDPKSLLVPEIGHLWLRREYESNLRGYRDGGVEGVHGWLLYAAEAYARSAEASPLNASARDVPAAPRSKSRSAAADT